MPWSTKHTNYKYSALLFLLVFTSGLATSCTKSSNELKVWSSVDKRAISNKPATGVHLVSSTSVNGTYYTSTTLTITVRFSQKIELFGPAKPVLSLTTGDKVTATTYESGSGSDTLIFSYRVADGDSSADLQYSGTDALTLDGGTVVKDIAGFPASLKLPALDAVESLGGQKNLVIKGVAASESVERDAATAVDLGPQISFKAASSTQSEGQSKATIDLSLSQPSTSDITVKYTVGGSASAPADHNLTSGTVTFPAGSSSAQIGFDVVEDLIYDGDETIIVVLSSPSAGAIGTPAIHTMTITDNETIPQVRFSSLSQTVTEGARYVIVEAQVTPLTTTDIVLPFTLSGTASTADHDLTATFITIPAGQPSGIIIFSILEDTLLESLETLILTGTSPVGTTLVAPSSHTISIADNDNMPTVQWQTTSQSVVETAGSITLTAALVAPFGADVTVPFSVSGTAERPADYTLTQSSVMIPAGSVTGSITLPLINDSVIEGNETIIFTMGTPINAVFGSDLVYTVNIADDDAAATVSFPYATATVGEAGGSFNIPVALSKTAIANVSIPYTVTGTVTFGADHDLSAGTLVIPAGSSSGVLPVSIVNDTIHEGDETIVVTFGAITNASLGAIGELTLTIADDDLIPNLSFTSINQSVNENSGSVTLTLQLSSPLTTDLSVPLVVSGTATQPDDHNMTGRSVTIPAGQLTASTSFTVVDDDRDEPDEAVIVTIGAVTGATVAAPSVHTVTIQDNDNPPEVGFLATAQSLDEGGGTATATIGLTRPSAWDISVPYTLAGTASYPSDYNLVAGLVTILAGQLSGTISIPVVDDAVSESNETLQIILGTPTNATAGATSVHTLTIIDNEPPLVSFAAASQSVNEDGSTATVTLQLSRASGSDVTVPLTVAGTASNPADHSMNARTVTIPAGQLTASTSFTTVDDDIDEPDETVIISMGVVTGATKGSPVDHTVTLIDTDLPPAVSFTASSQSVGEAVGTATATVQLSRLSTSTVSIPYTVGGNGSNPSDHNLAAGSVDIAAGQLTATITFAIVDDAIVEGPETVLIQLGTPTDATIGAPSLHTLTIIDNEPLPIANFAIASQTVSEAAAPTVSATVTLDSVSTGIISVPFTVGGTSTAALDHSLTAGTFTFAAGENSKAITFNVINDTSDENSETVVITLGAPTGATVGATGVHTVTILPDSDPAPSVAFASTSQSVSESAGTLNIPLVLSAVSGKSIQVGYNVSGSANNPADHNLATGVVTIPAGNATYNIPVTIVNDTVFESMTENIRVTLLSPVDATLGSIVTYDLFITDDDSANAPAPPESLCSSGSLATTCTISATKTVANGSVISGTGNLVIASGGIINTTVAQDSIKIAMGGSVTVQAGGKIDANLELSAANLDIQTSGQLIADGRGFAATLGTGAGLSGSGGGHGGAGAATGSAGGITYGSYSEPITAGAGGGAGTVSAAGAGGGTIKIVVPGTLTVNGTLSTNGAGGTGTTTSANIGNGGGAGGSLWLSATSLLGSGTIAAIGGNGGVNSANAANHGGGGGGGRIAIYGSNSSSFPGALSVAGGLYRGPSVKGSIYWDNHTNPCSIGSFSSDCTIASDVSINDGETWTISGNLTITGTGSIVRPSPTGSSTIQVGGALEIGSGGYIETNLSSLTVGTTMTMLGTSYITGNITSLSANSISLPAGSKITGAIGSLTAASANLASGSTITGTIGTWTSTGAVTWGGTITGAVSTLNTGTSFVITGTQTGGIANWTSTGNVTWSGALSGAINSIVVGGDLTMTGTQTGDITTWDSTGGVTWGGALTGSVASMSVGGAFSMTGTQVGNLGSLTAGSVNVALGALINANGKGYGPGTGPGAGTGSDVGSGGGSYGGLGGKGGSGGVAAVYGSLTGPVDLGSGGANGASTAGSGGGGVKISTTGSLTLNGAITANGTTAASSNFPAKYAGAGGSGGSIWLSAASLSGTGTLSATGGNGGNGGIGPPGGAGGGGRIAIYGPTPFMGTFVLSAGTYGYAADPGTLYTGGITNPCDAGGSFATNCSISSTFTVNGGNIWTVAGDLVIKNTASISSFASSDTIAIQTGGTFEIKSGATVAATISSLVSPNVIIAAGGTMTGDITNWSSSGNVTMNGTVNGSIGTMAVGGALTVGGTVKGNLPNVTANSVTIDALGLINASGAGSIADAGTAPGTGTAGTGSAGAGHGGAGIAKGTGIAGSTYGSATAPSTLGSGGGSSNSSGGAGGGAVKFVSTGTMTVNGTIQANGNLGSNYTVTSGYAGGGGSGGSIWLTAPTIAGTGSLSAQGGNGGNNTANTTTDGGAGGGGRIAIYSANSFAGTMSALGGSFPTSAGRGTIYTGSLANPCDAGGSFAGDCTISQYVTIEDGATWNVTGNLTITSTGSINALAAGNTAAINVGGVLEIQSGASINTDLSTLSTIGALILGNSASINGNLGTVALGGAMTLGSGASINGNITSFASGAMTLGSGASINGTITSLTAGVMSFAATSRIVGNIATLNATSLEMVGTSYITGTIGDLTIGTVNLASGSTITGDITNWTSSGNVTWGGTLTGTVTSMNVVGDFVMTGTQTGNLLGLSAASVNIAAGAQISATAKGYSQATGPGAGSSATGGTSGGSYGGRGSAKGAGVVTAIYGSLTNPADLGSGGGTGSTAGGTGGGAIKIIATGTFTLSGSLLANGANGTNYGGTNTYAGGGGSGGSVWLGAASFSGVGNISVTGGNGGDSHYGPNAGADGGAGGGGRVAILAPSNSFAGTINASGGSFPLNGGHGTIYFTKPCDSGGDFATSCTISKFVSIEDNATWDIAGALTLAGTGSINGESSTSAAALAVGGNLEMQSGASININFSSLTAPNVTIASGSTFNGDITSWNSSGSVTWAGTVNSSISSLTVVGNLSVTGTQNGSLNNLNAANVNIASTGSINATSSGYPTTQGPQAGGGTGGGYHSTYGSRTQPITYGSGGGTSTSAGGSGGGAIKIFTGILTVDGSIIANGDHGVDGSFGGGMYAGGGGAGGSVWLSSNSIVGTGLISANGGQGGNNGGRSGVGGGGGRVAVYSANSFGGTISVTGGLSPSNGTYGASGTIYLSSSNPCNVGDPTSNCTINNTSTFSGPSTTLTIVGDLTIGSGGVLQNLTAGDVNNLVVTGNLIVQTGGQLTANLATLSAANITVQSGAIISGNITSISTAGTLLVDGTITGTIGSITAGTLTVNDSIIAPTELITATTININGYYSGDIGRIAATTFNVNGVMEGSLPEAAATTITIGAGGIIDASGVGYAGSVQAVGKGRGGGAGSTTNGGGGGAHAGVGGNAATSGALGSTVTYGAATMPITLGSGGGGGQGTKGGSGGGIVRLIASGTLTHSGIILANGGSGASGSSSTSVDAAGGGAGGSIWLAAATLAGTTGSVSANGGAGGSDGAGSDHGGGGGGGYVRLSYSTLNSSTITSSAAAGAAGGGTSTSGAAGVTNTVLESVGRHFAFVTDTGFDGALGGLAGADLKCQSQAIAANLSGKWKAILGDANTGASSHISIRGRVHNFQNTLAATTSTDIWDGTIAAAISYSGKAVDQATQNVWTGSTSSGGVATNTCNSWTVNSSGNNGNTAISDQITATWITSADATCDQLNRFYCINQ